MAARGNCFEIPWPRYALLDEEARQRPDHFGRFKIIKSPQLSVVGLGYPAEDGTALGSISRASVEMAGHAR
jgi:hypothetical protein